MDKTDLIKALRSGDYAQHRGSMVDIYEAPTAFCCLGVAAHIIGADINSDNGPPYDAVREGFGISRAVSETLIKMNDVTENSFSEIADWIETHDLSTGSALSPSGV